MMMRLSFAGPGWRSLKIERQLDFIAAPKICDELLSAAAAESNLLAHRALLADSLERNIPSGVAEIYRDRRSARAAISSLAAA